MTKGAKKSSKKRLSTSRKIIIGLGSLLLLSGLVFFGYFLNNSIHSWEPNPNSYSEIINNKNYKISEKSSYYSIYPSIGEPDKGLIIYQGAFADARAYLAPYSKLADSGIAVFIVRSPFAFALFNVGGANKIIADNPQINNWYVAGHSLGGVAACEYAKTNTQKISGLILLGSFCNGEAKNINTKVLSVSTSKDGLSTPEKIQQNKDKLPKNTDFVIIDGGNHSQFADLEKLQPGDNEATITQDEATLKINDAITNFIIK